MLSFLPHTIWLVPIYSLIGVMLSVPWFPAIIRRTGPRPAGYINLVMTSLSFVHSVLALIAVWDEPAQSFVVPWLQVAGLDLTIPVTVSAMSVGAIALVTGLNLLAQIYSIGYMEMDWGWARFYALLAFFEAGMCSLAVCDSLFFSYVILEILTLATYLLVGFWFNQSLVVTGARDAFLTKRVGDLVLLMGVLALFPITGTWNFTELAEWARTVDPATLNPTLVTLVGLALIAGPMGKCAQFPLHLWLDEAMEGPIPSTILRNSVVVATGAWVLVKLEPFLALSPVVLAATIAVGALTAIGGALIAIAQIDMKRALSYLTSAYMGLVFMAVGAQQSEAALLLALSYAVAIALLYMVLGGIIWTNVSQDLTHYGGLWSRRPVSALAWLTGLAGMIALPPLGSFWAMLKLADGLSQTHPWLVGVLLLVNGLTAFSLMRVFGLIFTGNPKQMTVRSPEALWPMSFPMVLLAGFTLHLPLVLQALQLLPNWAMLNKELGLLLVLSSVSGVSLGALVYCNPMLAKPIRLPSKTVQNVFAYDFYTPQIYRLSIVFGVDRISRFTNWIDNYLVDGAVNFFGLATLFSGQSLKYSTSGQSQTYILTLLLGVGLISLLIFWF